VYFIFSIVLLLVFYIKPTFGAVGPQKSHEQ